MEEGKPLQCSSGKGPIPLRAKRRCGERGCLLFQLCNDAGAQSVRRPLHCNTRKPPPFPRRTAPLKLLGLAVPLTDAHFAHTFICNALLMVVE